MKNELSNLSTTPRDLRNFGFVVGGVFATLAAFFWWRNKDWFWWLAVPAAPLLVLGAIAPRSLRGLYLGWMAMAFTIGAIVSTFLLIGIFYLVVTPIGLIAKMFGNDFLQKKLRPDLKSYWQLRDHSKPRTREDHELQF